MKRKSETQGWRQRGICRYYLYWLLKMTWMWCFAVARTDIAWDYDASSEGWIAKEDTSMQWITGSGLIIGSTTGLNPHIDSPTFSRIVGYQERTVAALRLRYLGKSGRGRLDIRIGDHPGLEIGASQMVWGMELDKIPLVPKAIDSSNTLGMANVFDGDVITAWTSNPIISGPQWLEFDLSAPYLVTQFGLVVDGTVNTPASVVLQWYYVSGKRWISVGFPVFLERIEGEQTFSITPTLSQHWRLRILSTYENDQGTGLGQVSIQELCVDGPSMRSTAHAIEFDIIGDGKWHTYYIRIFESFQGTFSQLRFRPMLPGTGIIGQGWEIDFLHVAQAPRIDRVQGCIDRHYFSEREFTHQMGTLRTENIDQKLDGVLLIHETWFPPAGSVDASYSTTFNCPRSGGKEILIEGDNFGENYPPSVTVGGRECQITQNISQNAVMCLIPPGNETAVNVQVSDSVLPGLFHSVPSLGYAQIPRILQPPVVTNAASWSLDLSWSAESSSMSNSSNEWEGGVLVTGYEVEVSAIGATNSNSDLIIITLSNVTTTTVCGLHPLSTYSFRVRALVEPLDGDWRNMDLYGRRELIPGFLHGEFSEPSTGTTLELDILIPAFTAQSTWNTTMPSDNNASVGPRGQWGPEGHYGLNLIGSAHIEGCDLNTACCDGYPDCSGGDDSAFVCAGGVVAETNDVDSWVLSSAEGRVVDRACGTSLRITASVPGQAGAAWYRRMQTVVEGFSTTFTFKLSSPSTKCLVNDAHSKRRSRGGHGLAFVLQSESPVAIGLEGYGIGYEGIRNALIVEFDTVHNPEVMDPYENHISVLASGLDTTAQPHHSVSLGDSVNVPDLTSGIHTARIVYEPFFNVAAILAGQITATWQVGRLMKQWSTNSGGLGMLGVYLDGNVITPIVVVPINLEATIKLQHGRSFVGFTAATGSDA